jgi:hypothetical protein
LLYLVAASAGWFALQEPDFTLGTIQTASWVAFLLLCAGVAVFALF